VLKIELPKLLQNTTSITFELLLQKLLHKHH